MLAKGNDRIQPGAVQAHQSLGVQARVQGEHSPQEPQQLQEALPGLHRLPPESADQPGALCVLLGPLLLA